MTKAKKPKKKGIDVTILAVLIVVIILVGAVSGWYLYNLQNKNSGGGGNQTEKQKLLMGTSADFPPFEFVNSTTNQIEGFDIDIAQKIAEATNRTLVIRDISFDGLIPAVQAGTVDMVIAGMTITEQRKLAVDFSNPYFGGNQTTVVHKDTTNINAISDLNGKKIAVQLGTTGDLWVSNTSNVPTPSQIVRFSKYTEALLELEQKHVDVVVMDETPAKSYVAVKNTLKIAFNIHTEEKYGIAVKKGNSLLGDINRVLEDMFKSGEYDQLYTKWFG